MRDLPTFIFHNLWTNLKRFVSCTNLTILLLFRMLNNVVQISEQDDGANMKQIQQRGSIRAGSRDRGQTVTKTDR